MNTRKHDLETLRNEYKSANPMQRQIMERTAMKIRSEGSKINSMREALIKAHREGNHAEIKDIHEYIKNKREYR